MKKIRLEIDTLRVESFETVEQRDERGTVNAHQVGTRVGGCTETTCPPNYCFCTEDQTCRCQ